MNKEREERLTGMIRMRLDGCTYQEIADKYGVSRQCVQQSIADFMGRKRTVKKSSLEKCIYPNIRAWMLDSGVTMIRLETICGLNESSTGGIRRKLLGQTEFKISEIRRFCKRVEKHSSICSERKKTCERVGVDGRGKYGEIDNNK